MIKKTPLYCIDELRNIHIKLENLQPSGSIKYRAASAMINNVYCECIKYNKEILESSSGNTGIAVAYLCYSKQIPCTIVVPDSVSLRVLGKLSQYGATVITTDKNNGSDGSKLFAQGLLEKYPNKYCYLDQYSNVMNRYIHYVSTGSEIWKQSNGKITHFIAGIGTGGTITGIGKFLKVRNQNIKIIGVQPSDWYGISGLRCIETSFKPKNYDDTVVDETIFINTKSVIDLYNEDEYPGGYSTMANILASQQIPYHTSNFIVTVMPDGRVY